MIFDQVSDAVSDDASFARSCSSEDQHRPVHRLSGFSLLRIESTEVQALSLKEEAGNCPLLGGLEGKAFRVWVFEFWQGLSRTFS